MKYCVDNDNINDTELEWIWKKYRVANDNIDDTELEGIKKKYQVNNDTKTPLSQREEYDPVD